jgi:hypothetical protein
LLDQTDLPTRGVLITETSKYAAVKLGTGNG